jgi:hypothetical protein
VTSRTSASAGSGCENRSRRLGSPQAGAASRSASSSSRRGGNATRSSLERRSDAARPPAPARTAGCRRPLRPPGGAAPGAAARQAAPPPATPGRPDPAARAAAAPGAPAAARHPARAAAPHPARAGEEHADRHRLQPAQREGQRAGRRRVQPLHVVDRDQHGSRGSQRLQDRKRRPATNACSRAVSSSRPTNCPMGPPRRHHSKCPTWSNPDLTAPSLFHKAVRMIKELASAAESNRMRPCWADVGTHRRKVEATVTSGSAALSGRPPLAARRSGRPGRPPGATGR